MTTVHADDREGMISASLVIVIVVATVVGALVGLLLGSVGIDTHLVAIGAGFVASIVASIARYTILVQGARVTHIPTVLIVNAAIASIAGSLAAHDLSELVRPYPSPFLLGALAGMLSAILTALLMITYHSHPNLRR